MNQFHTTDMLGVSEGIICHQVNAQYVMGAGLAKQIAQKWPVVELRYKEERPTLGTAQLVNVGPSLWVANLVGQRTYGRGLQTNYTSLRTAMEMLMYCLPANLRELPIYIPYKMGCGLGGGDWSIVSKMIEDIIPHAYIVYQRHSDIGE